LYLISFLPAGNQAWLLEQGGIHNVGYIRMAHRELSARLDIIEVKRNECGSLHVAGNPPRYAHNLPSRKTTELLDGS
jgi:hypothetical protein